ncbi:MAG: hypothetical protein Kapaf2KO_23710 [Candidatus Kapaibacteriales bacterium]
MKPRKTGECSISIASLIAFEHDNWPIDLDEKAELMTVLSDITGIDLLDPENEDTRERQKAERLWKYLMLKGLYRQEFIELLATFEMNHKYPRYTIADFMTILDEKDKDLRNSLITHSKMQEVVHENPKAEFDTYEYGGRPWWKIKDGRKLPLMEWDEYKKTRETEETPE